MLIDTHAHIHFDEFSDMLESVFKDAKSNQLDSIITVGTNEEDSLTALNFINDPDVLKYSQGIELYSTAGIHPHDADRSDKGFSKLKEMVLSDKNKHRIKAIGECGLDYYKNYSSKAQQFKMLELQLSLAQALSLPVVFHVRDAWDDFFAIIKDHPDITGVIHSFTGYPQQVEIASKYNLLFGINGIMTFTKDKLQIEALKLIPEDRLLLETDCPYLTPAPYRGKINQPSYIKEIAQFVAHATERSLDSVAELTSQNAKELFEL